MHFHKVGGSENPADAFTKAVDSETLRAHLEAMGIQQRCGRAEVAPKAKSQVAATSRQGE